MLNRIVTTTAVAGVLLSAIAAPVAMADPDGPPVDTGVVASDEPATVTSPDGWVLTVAASNETELPVAPLTTAVSSREYLVGGTFTGTVTGKGKGTLTGGTLEAGYQIGCGIELGQIKLIGSVGATTNNANLFTGAIPTGVTFPLQGQIEVHPKPGTVTTVPVDKKSFKSAPVRVTLKDIHIKVDGCLGQSFLRSYATLTSSTADTDDIVAYYGITKSV
jgi:hypothetical protein